VRVKRTGRRYAVVEEPRTVARDGQREPVGTGRRTETTLGALHLAEEVATIGGQVALGQRRR
jgi:hypothetical protein